MTAGRKPPALLIKTLTVTFSLVTLLLLTVFAVAFYTVRLQIRDSVIQSLDTTQGLFVALENRRQVDLQRQAATLAESSTLKAALDTYIAEARTSDPTGRQQLLTTITRELEKVAARVESDAIVAVDVRQATLAAAGPFAGSWPTGGMASLAPATVATEDAVARVGDNLNVRVEMVDAAENRQMWSEEFNRKAQDLISIKQEIAQAASDKMRVKLSGAQEQQLAKKDTVNPQAYELLLKGRYAFAEPGTDHLKRSVAFFEQAVAADPNYALAYAELSLKYYLLAGNSVVDPKVYLPKAEDAARKA